MSERGGNEGSAQADPFLLWRQFVEANEQVMAGVARQMGRAHQLSDAEARLLEIYLALQRMMREALSAQLNTLNMPTREDLERLCELVVGVEGKVHDLDRRLARLERRITRPRKIDRLAPARAASAGRRGQRPAQSTTKKPGLRRGGTQ